MYDPIEQESVRWNFNKPEPFSEYLVQQKKVDLAGYPAKLSIDYDQEQLKGWMCEPLEGVSLAVCNSQITSRHKKKFHCDVPMIIFMLLLEGRIRHSFEQPGVGFQLDKNMFSCGDYSGLSGVTEMPVQKVYRHVSFSVKKEMFSRHFGVRTGEKILKKLLDNLNRPGRHQSHVSGLASPDIIMAGQRLFDLPHTALFDVLELKSASIEFITKLMLSVLGCRASSATTFSHQDIEAVKRLKTRLEKDIFNSGNIVELCASIGMSRSKASTVFKHLYNTTIGKYQRTCRMVYAYHMLFSRKRNVSECAYELGYTNIGHFISAFKKQYQKTPGEVFSNGIVTGDSQRRPKGLYRNSSFFI